MQDFPHPVITARVFLCDELFQTLSVFYYISIRSTPTVSLLWSLPCPYQYGVLENLRPKKGVLPPLISWQ